MIYETYTVGGYLYHHGIAGQKWGKRNGPPYPLKPNAHSPSEKKAGWKSSLSSNTDINKRINKLRKKEITKDANEQKAIAELLAITVGPYVAMMLPIAGMAVAQHVTDKKIEKKVAEDEKRRASEKTDKKTGLKIKNKEMSEEEDVQAVNRRFKHSDNSIDANNNCVYCSVTYEMRRRGFDAAANPSSYGMNGREYTRKMFTNTKVNMMDTYGLVKKYNNKKDTIDFNYTTFSERKKLDDLRKKAARNNNKDYARSVINTLSTEKNSRGSLFVQWGFGGGHALSYKVENGNVTIIDPQAGKIFKGKDAEKYFYKTWLASSIRLDKSEINYDNKKMIKKAME